MDLKLMDSTILEYLVATNITELALILEPLVDTRAKITEESKITEVENRLI
jgi:hypothetical protein